MLGGGELCELACVLLLAMLVRGVLEGVLAIELFELFFPLFWLDVDIFSGIRSLSKNYLQFLPDNN